MGRLTMVMVVVVRMVVVVLPARRLGTVALAAWRSLAARISRRRRGRRRRLRDGRLEAAGRTRNRRRRCRSITGLPPTRCHGGRPAGRLQVIRSNCWTRQLASAALCRPAHVGVDGIDTARQLRDVAPQVLSEIIEQADYLVHLVQVDAGARAGGRAGPEQLERRPLAA